MHKFPQVEKYLQNLFNNGLPKIFLTTEMNILLFIWSYTGLGTCSFLLQLDFRSFQLECSHISAQNHPPFKECQVQMCLNFYP